MTLSRWRRSSHGNHGGSYFRQLGSKTWCSAKKTAIYFALQQVSERLRELRPPPGNGSRVANAALGRLQLAASFIPAVRCLFF
jgi:hypothetical protein